MIPGFWVHPECRDVCLQVYWSGQVGEYLEVRGAWWNLGYTGNPWVLDEAVVKIRIKDICKWRYAGDECPKRKAQ